MSRMKLAHIPRTSRLLLTGYVACNYCMGQKSNLIRELPVVFCGYHCHDNMIYLPAVSNSCFANVTNGIGEHERQFSATSGELYLYR